MKKIVVLLPLVVLAGCASYSRTMTFDPKVHHVTMDDGRTYRIFEHKSENYIMTSPSIGDAMAGGAVKGLTFGIANPMAKEQRHEEAARKYLDETGREACKIVSGHMLMDPQYEFAYQCDDGSGLIAETEKAM